MPLIHLTRRIRTICGCNHLGPHPNVEFSIQQTEPSKPSEQLPEYSGLA